MAEEGGRPLARVLTVAGSDSGGGAGIEADLKTIERLGGYGMAAVTAVTAQNTRGVFGIWTLPPEAVEQQITVVAEDLGLDAAKCGMLGEAPVVRAVARTLARYPVPLVVDPVMVAKGGERLLAHDAEDALRDDLLPLATLVTPNLPEAEALTGLPVKTRSQREEAAGKILSLGPKAVLLKGGHAEGDVVEDLLWDGREMVVFSNPRVPTVHTHGTGCTLSAAIATGLGQGMSLRDAVDRAIRYVQAAIRWAPGLGGGRGPLGHHAGQPPWEAEKGGTAHGGA